MQGYDRTEKQLIHEEKRSPEPSHAQIDHHNDGDNCCFKFNRHWSLLEYCFCLPFTLMIYLHLIGTKK